MPKPRHHERRYFAGLDGIRAVAVTALVASGLGVSALDGGEVGFSVFFALSGYLITDLLLTQIRDGRPDLVAFWCGRASRLLPPLAVMLVVTFAWVTLVGPKWMPGLQDAAISSLASVNNLLIINDSTSYLSQFQPPAAFDHLWALSIVGQFYLAWPLVLFICIRVAPGVNPTTGGRRGLCVVILVLAVVSLAATALLYSEINPVRAYYGTSCRSAEILVGAALAAARPSNRMGGIGGSRTSLVDALGFLGLGAIVAIALAKGAVSPPMFRAGFVVTAFATVPLIIAVTNPATVISKLLGAKAIVWLGVRSYGIFLWHLPVIAVTSPEDFAEPDPLRVAVQLGATLVLAAVSWRYIEQPVRGGWIGRTWARVRDGAERPRRAVQAGLVAAGAVLGVACVGFSGAATSSSEELPAAVETADIRPADGVTYAPHTSCRGVVHIGDAGSAGLVSDELVERDRIAAQYEVAGIGDRHIEVAPTRFISEHFSTEESAEDIVNSMRSDGYGGCWVLALGTDDVASTEGDSSGALKARIDSLMSELEDEKVMWVNLKTQADAGQLADSKMDAWNVALRRACGRYRKMRVFDWAGTAQGSWFEPDGIQLTSRGNRARAVAIATALSDAFSVGEHLHERAGKDCVIDLPAATVRRLTAPPGPFDVSFAGDITPGSSYGLPPDDARPMFSAVRADLSHSDFAVGNLEGTLSKGGASKCGADTSTCFSFQAPPANAKGLRWAGFDLMNVANNHAFDFGPEGQEQTLEALAREDIESTGLPGEVTITDVGSTRVATIGFAPYEWSNLVGDLEREADLIRAARSRSDAVVVIAHLGAEGADQGHTPSGTEYAFGEDRGDTRAFARNAIDAGAALVLASGPHVLRGMERYRGGLIAYSLGNFAGWDNFSTVGPLGVSAMLDVEMSQSGRALGGRVVPLRLVEPGVPTADEDRTAIATMNALSQEDFGADGVHLSRGGEFRLVGERRDPGKAR